MQYCLFMWRRVNVSSEAVMKNLLLIYSPIENLYAHEPRNNKLGFNFDTIPHLHMHTENEIKFILFQAKRNVAICMHFYY